MAGAAALLGRRHEVRAWWSNGATTGAAPSASRPPTWPFRATSACRPTASTPAGTSGPTAPSTRPPSRSAGGPPSTRRPGLAARGPPARLRRRPLRRSRPASASWPGCGARQRFGSIDALVEQMARDVTAARVLLGRVARRPDPITGRSVSADRRTAGAGACWAARRRLSSSRRRLDARVGRVGRRGVSTCEGGGQPVGQPFEGQVPVAGLGALVAGHHPHHGPETGSSSRSRWPRPREGEPSTSKRTSTRVLDVLACWPPGPPEAEKRHSSSSSGIATGRESTRSTVPSFAAMIVTVPGPPLAGRGC